MAVTEFIPVEFCPGQKKFFGSGPVLSHNRLVAGKGPKKTRMDAVKLLPEVIRRLLAISDADLLLHEVCSLASDALGADEVSLLLADPTRQELIEHEVVGKKLRPTRFRLKIKDEGISGWRRSGRPPRSS